ncbi:MAG: hypothetical protein OXP71_10805 [Candidatus Poribacteria bacterium]|nr:hypothetical protein [Candidatus Poribacteria bacterium]
MKRKYPILLTICCLFVIAANPDSQAEDTVTATFTFGKIEVLKSGEREWAFLEKGAVLNNSDLVRMPPYSLIRLKDADEMLLPTLPGGRELPISVLIEEGRLRRNEFKGKRVSAPFDSRPAIDVLPLGNRPKGENRFEAPAAAQPTPLMRGELEALRRELDSLPEEFVPFISRSLLPDNHATTDAYPSTNLSSALTLYRDTLREIEAKTEAASNRSLLYAQLLGRIEIGADLVVNGKGDLFVVFDSGVPVNGSKQITANHQLIHHKSGTDTVWIPLQITPRRHNFTTAWYTAGRNLEDGL